MKIICFIDSLGSGGAQRQLIELAKGFKLKGHSVSFITYHPMNFFQSQLMKEGISIKTVIEPNYLKRILKIRKIVRKIRPDVLLSFLEGVSFIATLVGFPYKKWVLIVGERSANPKILKSPKLRFYRIFHLFADYVVGNSKTNITMVQKMNPFLSKEKLKVIYNIVNVPKNSFNEIEKTKETTIVVGASYLSVKNLDGLIEAVKLLPEVYKKKIKIKWFGNMISENNLLLQNAKREILKSNLEEVFSLKNETLDMYTEFSKSDFVGLFSHYEGFPNSIVEGMALGKPVIVTRVSDVPLLINEPENGFLCESEDYDSIKHALMKAIDSNEEQRRLMGLKNKEIAEKKFNKEEILKQYLSLMTRNT